MKWVGITGGIASGKSLICQHLADRGFPVISADQVVRELSEPGQSGYQKIVQCFGREILLKNGAIDRKALGGRVFQSPQDLRELEKILHPLVQDLVQKKREILQNAGYPVAFYEVPLLFEKHLEKNFDFIILVSVDSDQQIQRLMKRDGLAKEDALLRVNAQLPESEKIDKSDFIVQNVGGIEEFKKEVDLVIQKILGQA